MNNIVKNITDRLSLRRPQIKSLVILDRVLESIDLSKDIDLKRSLEVIQGMYPSVQSFERDFPSLCFGLATGVGKTRLMGAFISYLYLTGRSRHFFVLAPNLTIYEKLKEDFTPQSPKYVFRGITEFVSSPPVIITGEDYDTGKGVRFDENNFYVQGRMFKDSDTPFINIFNISKINATENKKGAGKSNTPRIKRLQETIGESYFDYLAGLDDLVLLMDEAHRYRSTAGANAINELKPVLGIELTATPKTIGSAAVDFKNIIYAYSLSEAMTDGYVKEPAVATRKDFNLQNYTPEQLEGIKLKDGIYNHKNAKAELEVYAHQYNKEIVKPFMLVVAQDTEHARKLRKFIESDSFFEGLYKGKVAEVHSKQSGAEEDENIQKLISIENPNEPTEIVIHVNKLKEGWDVTNLYTIVPLRASASEILTEQTIGRGLRLPYGRRTGVEAVDLLTIIAHDRFQEIIDRANDPDSIIKKKIELGNDGEVPFKAKVLEVPSRASMLFTGATVPGILGEPSKTLPEVTRKTPEQKKIAELAMNAVGQYEHLSSSSELSSINTQKQLAEQISKKIKSDKETWKLDKVTTDAMIHDTVKAITENFSECTIDIPNIILIPSSKVTYGFHDFDLEGLERLNFEPVSEEILVRHLRTNKSSFVLSEETGFDGYKEGESLENYITQSLMNHELVDYGAHADLLYKLAKQTVEHFKSYLPNEKDVKNVLVYKESQIANFILVQLKQHCWETPTGYEMKVKQGFKTLKPFKCTIEQGTEPRDFRSIPEVKSNVRKIVFSGFMKCCYPLQKFDSVDGELRFAQVLEDDNNVVLWMKPAPGFFQIEYKNGMSYEPDFIVEAKNAMYLCEPKMASEMNSGTVLDKQNAAVEWCQYATQHTQENGGKPWFYALIPHNAIGSNRSFDSLMDDFVVRPTLLDKN